MDSVEETPENVDRNENQDGICFPDTLPNPCFLNCKNQEDSDDDLLDILIELSNSDNDDCSHSNTSEKCVIENENLGKIQKNI